MTEHEFEDLAKIFGFAPSTALRQLADHVETRAAAQATAHAPGCWSWGPKHYMCAYRRLKAVEIALGGPAEPPN